MRRYKGGGIGDRLYSDSMFFQLLEVAAYLFIFYELIELFIILPINMVYHTDRASNCAKDSWISGLLINNFLKKPCPESGDNQVKDNKCTDLGRWKAYDKGKGFLCSEDADKIWNNAIDNNVVAGYNATELLAYVVVPTLTILAIVYGLIFTRLNIAEWIFWILIGTLVYTGLTTVSKNTDLELLPPQETSPLSYVKDKLDLKGADELEYSFLARRGDGKQCMIEGTITGDGGIHTPGKTPTYTGDISNCNVSSLPME